MRRAVFTHQLGVSDCTRHEAVGNSASADERWERGKTCRAFRGHSFQTEQCRYTRAWCSLGVLCEKVKKGEKNLVGWWRISYAGTWNKFSFASVMAAWRSCAGFGVQAVQCRPSASGCRPYSASISRLDGKWEGSCGKSSLIYVVSNSDKSTN